MNKMTLNLLILSIFLAACSRSATSAGVPDVHLPSQLLSRDFLKNFVLSYCWQYPDGRVSQNDQENKEIVVVLSSGDGLSTEIIRDPNNLRDNAPGFYIYKAACVKSGDGIRYITDAIVWRPLHNAITFTSQILTIMRNVMIALC